MTDKSFSRQQATFNFVCLEVKKGSKTALLYRIYS